MFTDKRLTVVGKNLRQRLPDGIRKGESIVQTASHKEQAFFPNTVGSTPTSVMGFGSNQYTRTFSGILPDQQEESLIDYYRDCYYYDSVAGGTVDMISVFPFSAWTLGGVSKEVAAIYSEALTRLDIRSLMPEISRDHLVDGEFIGTLVYDKGANTFTDIMVHDKQACTVVTSPFRSVESAIHVHSSAKLLQYLEGGGRFAQHLMKNYPPQLIRAFMNGNVELDPLTTIHVPRKALQDRGSASFLKRVLPYYLLERTLYRGTLIEASKRQRATTHIQVGDDTWEPTSAELGAVRDMFQNTELDPLGAWVVTRQGVQINDVRPGGDFWKWTDVADQITPMKLRALGVSEAFLAGDANFSCLVGDTLIPTTEGLRRIDSFGTGKDRKKSFPIKTVMDSRYGKETAVAWMYNGFQNTIRVTVETGNSIQATSNHPILVLRDGELVWKRTDRLQLGDTLCVSRNKVVRTKPLKLNVLLPEARSQKIRVAGDRNCLGDGRGMNPGSHQAYDPGTIVVPKYMTTKLAYWLALLISEGTTRGEDKISAQTGRAGSLGFGNTDERLTKRFASLAEELFGVQPSDIMYKSVEELNAIATNKDFRATKPFFTAIIRNRRLVDWLVGIGVYLKPGRVDGFTPSYFKRVPWSVLQADEESQKAFLAGYAECDGSVGERTSWFSKSKELISQVRALLNSHGYQPTAWGDTGTNVTLCREDSANFWNQASKYLTTKKSSAHGGKYSKLDGIPSAYWTDLVKQRKSKSDRHGGHYLADDGHLICWSKNKSSVSTETNNAPWGFNVSELKRFNYQAFESGVYDNFLRFLKELSPAAHEKLITLFKTPYRYSDVVRIEDAGKAHVYDISMKPGKEPAFVANGLVVHNTSEMALTVFLENMSAYREFLTHRLFDSKLLPLIAVLKGLYKDKSKVRNPDSVRDLMFNAANHKNLEIPTIQWHKSLEAKDGENQFEVLEKLSEKGYPIPMKMWAAAANIDIGSLISDLNEDKEIKEAIEKITGQNPDDIAQQNQEGGDMESAAMRRMMNPLASLETRSIKDKLASRRGPALLNRDFTHIPITKTSKSGKVQHAIVNERAAVKKSNELILKASQALQDPENAAKMRKRIVDKLGRVPNIIGMPGK